MNRKSILPDNSEHAEFDRRFPWRATGGLRPTDLLSPASAGSMSRYLSELRSRRSPIRTDYPGAASPGFTYRVESLDSLPNATAGYPYDAGWLDY
jgi:hypothetical protein